MKTFIAKLLTLARSYRIAWKIRRLAVIGYISGAISEVAGSLLVIFASAKLADALVDYLTTGETSDVWLWFSIDIIGAVFTALGFWLMSYNTRLLYFSFSIWSMNQFIEKICLIDIEKFDDNDTRTLINKVADGYAWKLAELSAGALDLAYGVLRLAAMIVVISQISWWLMPIIILFLIPSLLAEGRVAKLQWFVFNEKGDERHIFWGLDWIIKQRSRQLEIRAMQAKDFISGKINSLNNDFYSTQEQRYKKANQLIVPSKISEIAGVAIGTFLLIQQFLDRLIPLDTYLFLSGALIRVGGALNAIFGTLARMQESLLFAESYYEFLNIPTQRKDKPSATTLTRTKAPTIEFDNVSFSYPETERFVFKDLSFTINSGEHVALVGENGAGKSTLIKLLLRFYVPDSGRILVNGHNIQDIKIDTLYAQVATLFQDFNQYPLTIEENIATSTRRSTDKVLLEQAAREANAHSMIMKYPHTWETVLDPSFQKGVEPSGGQWQRVALARAFYRNANMIILDEPTSAIDAKAEYDIFNNIFKHYRNKTAIIVSHRFSTVRRADRIIVIDSGKIIEQGSHKELMEQKGLYHDLFTKQAEGYKD